ncbi:hypothetical protein CPB83DRAFT_760361, partial [Crepidotus variabilis]
RLSPTRTNFNTTAGPVLLSITCLSPIEVSNSMCFSSFPFSYVTIDVISTDGQPHNVQLYPDLTGELLSNDLSDKINFNTTQTTSSTFHTLQSTSPTHFQERNKISDDSISYLGALSKVRSSPLRIGRTERTTSQPGKLGLSPITVFRITKIVTCVALSYDLGEITETASPAVFALGLIRDPSIRAVTLNGTKFRIPFFRMKYTSLAQAIEDFLEDFEGATERVRLLDTKIMDDGNAISSSYANLLAFSSRSAFGAMDITVPLNPSEDLDLSGVKVYLKDLGNSGRVNAVKTIFSAFPAFLYLNAMLAGRLLEPLLDFQSSPPY